jgi:transcription termination/antitermination protein NusA
MNFKDFLAAMQALEGNRNITKEIVLDALNEALVKAYRKHIEIPDALVKVDIDQTSGEVGLFQQYTIVEEVEDDELEISLKDAQVINPEFKVGELHSVKVNIDDLGRAAALLAKNVMKQKIREAEKKAVYDEYIDKLDEMVIGMVESVEEKFVVVNLGKTLAMMPKAAQIPNEIYKEGQKIRLVITEVTKDTKGAQVLVSRADTKLVKRLFEKEVPEIFQGIVEIKAIAREAGERTKMAVFSKRDDVDPIGACIGPRGSRVQVVIEELKGEKIDIFEWRENIIELIKNALSPAQILAVLQSEEKRGIIVVVEDDQLSLAIGKKGKNARLAVRLTGMKIDIKSRTDIEAEGRNWQKDASDFSLEQEAKIVERKARKLQEERVKQAEVEAIKQKEYDNLNEDLTLKDDEDLTDTYEEKEFIATVPAQVEVKDVVQKDKSIDEKPSVKPETKVVEKVEKPKKERKPLEVRHDYVSKFEAIADNKPIPEKKEVLKRKTKKQEEEERILRPSELKKDKDYDIKIEYTEEELAEIALKDAVENKQWEDEIDFDEFEDYYEDEE